MRTHATFGQAIHIARDTVLRNSHVVKPGRWQGVDLKAKPEAEMREVLHHSFQVRMQAIEELDHWRADIAPNLPWADLHFEDERVSGHPINPGETWKVWPWAHSAGNFLKENEQYNHSYAERYWPKFAGRTSGGILTDTPPVIPPQFEWETGPTKTYPPHRGIRYEYADLNDLIQHLNVDPSTRQAYLPVWFPEDGSHNDRKPCTLGYWFIQRDGAFDVTYYIRSCDFARHFRDDCYLTVRLAIWILDRLRELDPGWKDVRLGTYTMHIGSLHLFINDFHRMSRE
jgi:hypothetical protein